MTHWSDNLRVNLKVSGGEDCLEATFSLEFEDGEDSMTFSRFRIYEPKMFRKETYLEFADGKIASMNHCDDHGSIGIFRATKGRIHCIVSRFEKYADGRSVCCFPEHLFIPKLREMVERIM